MSQQQRVLNKKLSQIFRINGLTVRPDAMQPLYDVLEGEPEWESVLNQVLEQVQQQKLKGGCVGREAVETALSSLAARKVQGSTLPFEAVDAFALAEPYVMGEASPLAVAVSASSRIVRHWP